MKQYPELYEEKKTDKEEEKEDDKEKGEEAKAEEGEAAAVAGLPSGGREAAAAGMTAGVREAAAAGDRGGEPGSQRAETLFADDPAGRDRGEGPGDGRGLQGLVVGFFQINLKDGRREVRQHADGHECWDSNGEILSRKSAVCPRGDCNPFEAPVVKNATAIKDISFPYGQ